MTQIDAEKGPCIAYDENGKEAAWMYVDEQGNYVVYNDEGALYVVTAIREHRNDKTD